MNRYPKDSPIQVAENFQAKDFDCPCKHCRETLVDLKLIEQLQYMRELLGIPLVVTSGYRCQAHQDELAAQGYETAKNSMHLVGGAADVRTGKHSGVGLERAARKAGFRAVGVGGSWAHVDVRDGKDRRWIYSKR